MGSCRIRSCCADKGHTSLFSQHRALWSWYLKARPDMIICAASACAGWVPSHHALHGACNTSVMLCMRKQNACHGLSDRVFCLPGTLAHFDLTAWYNKGKLAFQVQSGSARLRHAA